MFKENGQFYVVEFLEGTGWRMLTLNAKLIESGFPGKRKVKIDVFRPLDQIAYDTTFKSWDADTIDKFRDKMLSWAGMKYGWASIFKIAMRRLMFFRFLPANVKDDDQAKIYVCSTAVAVALRHAYYDPVPYLPDDMVAPTDLARSALLRYQFTIEEDTCCEP